MNNPLGGNQDLIANWSFWLTNGQKLSKCKSGQNWPGHVSNYSYGQDKTNGVGPVVLRLLVLGLELRVTSMTSSTELLELALAHKELSYINKLYMIFMWNDITKSIETNFSYLTSLFHQKNAFFGIYIVFDSSI